MVFIKCVDFVVWCRWVPRRTLKHFPCRAVHEMIESVHIRTQTTSYSMLHHKQSPTIFGCRLNLPSISNMSVTSQSQPIIGIDRTVRKWAGARANGDVCVNLPFWSGFVCARATATERYKNAKSDCFGFVMWLILELIAMDFGSFPLGVSPTWLAKSTMHPLVFGLSVCDWLTQCSPVNGDTLC